MEKTKYIELYKSEPEEIQFSEADVIEYADKIVDAVLVLDDAVYRVEFGKLEDGKYENTIYPCDIRNTRDEIEVHIFKGIDLLAKATGNTLTRKERHDSLYPYELVMYYRGVRFFQLINGEKESEGAE